jgi:hypothetical protein
MPALSDEVASKYMKAAKLEPLVPYPGNSKLPWKSRCLQCGIVVKPSLSSVRNNGGGCRPCGLRKSAKSRSTDQSLAISVMRMAGAEPISEYPGSGKPWLCKCTKCGKEILPRYGNVKKGTAACVYCSGMKIDSKDAADLMIKYGYTPLVEYPGSNSPWKAIHNICGEPVAPRFTALQSGKGGCQKCGYKATKEKQMGDPEKALAIMINAGLQPLEDYPGANRPWKCECLKCGRIISPQYNRVKSGTGCAFCAGKMVSPEEAVEVMLNAQLQPLEPYPGARKHWKCRCLRCNRNVSPTYGDVRIGDGGCKFCGKKYVDPDEASELMRNKGFIPQVPYPGNGARWHCKCAKCGRDVYPAYNTVNGRNSGCKYCQKVFVDEVDAVALMLKNNLQPLVPYPGASKPWKCSCLVCGKKVSPRYGGIVQGQGGCGYCSRSFVDPDDAVQVMLKNQLEPLEPYSKSDGPWKCKCMKCGRTVTPAYVAVNGGQGGCKYCASRGIDYAAPAFVYLITHKELGAHKIGIGNDKTKNNRLKEHAKAGWQVFDSIKVESGEKAEQIEQEVLRWIRTEKNLPIFLLSEQMPQGGYSETVGAEEIDLPTIWAKVNELSKVVK